MLHAAAALWYPPAHLAPHGRVPCPIPLFLTFMKKHSPSAAPRGPRTKLRTFADYREDAFARRVVGTLSLSRGGMIFASAMCAYLIGYTLWTDKA